MFESCRALMEEIRKNLPVVLCAFSIGQQPFGDYGNTLSLKLADDLYLNVQF
jgi:hypothetical protein